MKLPFCIFASAHGRTKYALFRTVRPFAHPLATKARRRQRQNPFRNCAFFRVHCPFSFPFSTKAHRRPRLHCALFRPSVRRRAIAASPRLLLRVCLSPRGVLSISPGGGVLFPLRLKTEDERLFETLPENPLFDPILQYLCSAPKTSKRVIFRPPIVRKPELSTCLPKDIRRPRFLPFYFSRFLHAFFFCRRSPSI